MSPIFVAGCCCPGLESAVIGSTDLVFLIGLEDLGEEQLPNQKRHTSPAVGKLVGNGRPAGRPCINLFDDLLGQLVVLVGQSSRVAQYRALRDLVGKSLELVLDPDRFEKQGLQVVRLLGFLAKAKELRRVIEPMITLAKVPTVANRRLAFDRLRSRDSVVKLFDVLGPRYAARPGGYTRILKMGFRVGDNAPMAFVELVDRPEIADELVEEADKAE